MIKEHIGIAMSGGVDSTACALLLQKDHTIHGFFMRLAQPDYDRQLARVTSLASRLGVPLTVIDLREEFSRRVLEYFSSAYLDGITPNPCMICNQEIKFGLFQEAILAAGMERVATGHYAGITNDADGYHLYDGVDQEKNQSYFLSRLNQEQLARTLFPLGNRNKSDIYSLVAEHGFVDFEGIESQDICFLADQTVGEFLELRHPEAVQPGPIVSTDGKQLGEHRGLFRYTIGQRRGLGIPDSSPWYVHSIDTAANTLIVCKNEALSRTELALIELHWISGKEPDLTRHYLVRIRYSHRGSMARIVARPDGSIRLIFDEAQRAITPGQFAVIYNEDEVLGSGVIT